MKFKLKYVEKFILPVPQYWVDTQLNLDFPSPQVFEEYSCLISSVKGMAGNMSVTLVLPPGRIISVHAYNVGKNHEVSWNDIDPKQNLWYTHDMTEKYSYRKGCVWEPAF